MYGVLHLYVLSESCILLEDQSPEKHIFLLHYAFTKHTCTNLVTPHLQTLPPDAATIRVRSAETCDLLGDYLASGALACMASKVC